MSWPDPPPPRRPLAWSGDDARVTATDPSGIGWRIERAPDGRHAITVGDRPEPDWWADTQAEACALVDRFAARLDDPMPPALGRAWAEVEAAHDELRAAAEARVAEWQWWPHRADIERFEPFWAEQDGQRPVKRRLRAEPATRSDGKHYGFDASGRVVVAREFGGAEHEVQREVLRVGHVLLVFVARGWREPMQRFLGELHVPHRDEHGRIAGLEIWFHGPGSHGFRWWGTRYGYDGERLVAIHSTGMEGLDRGWERRRVVTPLADIGLRRRTPLSLAYDEDTGQLQTIVTSKGFVAYRRSAPGAARRAKKLLRDELPGRIAAWARRAAPDEPVYCLGVLYGTGLPPSLGLGTVRERERWRSELQGDELLTTLWNPAEFACFDSEPPELLDDELVAAYHALDQERAATSDERQPRQLLVAIAKALAAEPPAGLRTAASGLAVYAVDLELEDLERNLRASVPAALRR